MFKGIPITVTPAHSILLPDPIYIPPPYNSLSSIHVSYGCLLCLPLPRAHQYPIVLQQAGGQNVDNSTSHD